MIVVYIYLFIGVYTILGYNISYVLVRARPKPDGYFYKEGQGSGDNGFFRGNMLRLGVCMIPTGGSGAVAGWGWVTVVVQCCVTFRTVLVRQEGIDRRSHITSPRPHPHAHSIHIESGEIISIPPFESLEAMVDIVSGILQSYYCTRTMQKNVSSIPSIHPSVHPIHAIKNKKIRNPKKRKKESKNEGKKN